MNHAQSNKLNLVTAKENHARCVSLLKDHPKNAVLTEFARAFVLIAKRCGDAIDEGKREGYSPEFQALWKLFNYRTGSKSDAYGAYCKCGAEHEAIMSAVRLYKVDIKRGDITQAHLTTWLNQKRWESYEDVKAAKRTRTCPRCHKEVDKLFYHGYRDERGSRYSEHICVECKEKRQDA